jgi:ribosomal protein S18 acetylase RimI-like enzyme
MPGEVHRPERIRPYEPRDRDDVYEICVRTGARGSDARGQFSSDSLLPDVYAGPYLEFAPELAFVVDDGERVTGYILGVADTRAFVSWFRAVWLPRFAEAHPLAGDLAASERRVIEAGFRPERMLIPELEDYPAHLHIDLLPEAQGAGLGRRLVETLGAALRVGGVPGLYLQVDPANTGAIAFYERLAFVALPSGAEDGSVRGMRL